jgi:rod shape-determining protein MreC
MIERTRAQGLVRGLGTTLSMDYVPGTADVREGDLVVTSGIDKIYPKGFVIGTVEAIERGSGTFHEIVVQPSVDFSRLEEVLVVTTPPPAITAEQIAKEAEAIAAQQRQQQTQASPPQTAPSRAAPLNRTPANTTPRNVSPREPGA